MYQNKDGLFWCWSASPAPQRLDSRAGCALQSGIAYSPAGVPKFVGHGICYYLKFPAPLWLTKVKYRSTIWLLKGVFKFVQPYKKRPSR